MDDISYAMQNTLQDALDTLVSGRSSVIKRSQSLNDLESLIARVFTSSEGDATVDQFLALQDTFECNVPSRILSWISTASTRLEFLLSRGLSDGDREAEASTVSAQLVQSLSIVQGVALCHRPTKLFLGRKYPLEVLLELLLVSRHIVPSPDALTSTGPSTPAPPIRGSADGPKQASPPLASAVLDTLLCILVDFPPALRVFEGCNGVQLIVKLLKRANTPRDVRMKCLEFLYFYLLDETTPGAESAGLDPPMLSLAPLSPSPFITESRARDRSHALRDASTASSGSDESSTSASSRSSSSSASSATSAASSIITTPTSSPPHAVKSPPRTPTRPSFAKPRSLLLLQQDVDFVPLSPKKAQVSRLGVEHPRHASMSTPSSKLRTSRWESNTDNDAVLASRQANGSRQGPEGLVPESGNVSYATDAHDAIKTTEQKKEFLGRMLGNVDALVEGVKKAGVWGLG
ncbi:CDC14-domain-containing protein [Artomyces pyxidatus]|uniref:CDC14-domain-containing protein n=1 Tax=Artomyces pyxidatus TaxID=48021 RepID=A0ACB8TJT0_9AGAM|nr:CDC14-domain-containing protein [Artomyces pyxidatus]